MTAVRFIEGQLTLDAFLGFKSTEPELLLDHAMFAALNRLSGPRVVRDQSSRRKTGLDRPEHALRSRRCRCTRWRVVLFDGGYGSGSGEMRCIKCGLRAGSVQRDGTDR
jgi:hypothetical protein